MTTSTETYKLFAEYYDLYTYTYTEDLEFYKSVCNEKNKILEIGSGTGRVLQFLLQSGYSITGVDISDEMMDIAKKKLGNYIESNKLILTKHDFSHGKLSERFDLAIVTFYTFNYIIQNPVGFLKNVYKSLNKNAVIIMDLFYPQSLLDGSIENKWKENDFKIINRKISLKDKRRKEGNIEYRVQIYRENSKEIQIETERRYYNPFEIKNFLEEAGFKNIQFSLTFQFDSFKNEINEKELVKNYLVKAEK